jgi:choline dehydrogenase
MVTSDQTRSYSRSGYFPSPKSNVEILTGFTVTKVNFDSTGSNITATGVSFMSSRDSETYTVQANTEVILAAGVIGSPHILQLSGVGPSSLLQACGIDVVLDLPGVGAHLQDHVSTALVYSTTADVTGDEIAGNTTFSDDQLNLWSSGNGNSSLFSAPNEAITYANLTTVLGASAAQTYISQVKSNLSAVVDMYGFEGTVAEGYKTIYEAELTRLVEKGEPEVEFLMANTGWNGGASGKTVTLQFAIQHPFSRGALKVTTSDPFTMPSIDPGYLTHPGDITIMREAFRYLRQFAQTSPMSHIVGSEISPGMDTLSSDDDAAIDAWIRGSVSTEYHPAGTCSMLPLELGGVVDEQTRVHGINGLRVIDSSVIPVGLAAHLCSPTYAIAELGVAMVKGETLLVSASNNASTTSSTKETASGTATSSNKAQSATAAAGANGNAQSDAKTGSALISSSVSVLAGSAVFAMVIALLS